MVNQELLLIFNEFIEEYDQNHIRLWRVPTRFVSKYRQARLTYNEWITLLNMYVPGEVPD